MRKLIPYMTALIAVSLMFVMGACSKRSNNQTSSNKSQSSMSDSDVEKTIQNRIKSDPQLSAFNIKVNADSKSNEVKLSGTVNSEDARRKAVQIAQSALPGFAVSDTIDVKPRELARSEEQSGNQDNMNNQNQNQKDMNKNQSDRDRNYDRNLNQNQNQTPAPAR